MIRVVVTSHRERGAQELCVGGFCVCAMICCDRSLKTVELDRLHSGYNWVHNPFLFPFFFSFFEPIKSH